jgi:hypothetical protein
MARTAICDITTGKVINVIQLEAGANWRPPAGLVPRVSVLAEIGDTLTEDGTIIKGPPVPEDADALRRKAVRAAFASAPNDQVRFTILARLVGLVD